MKFFRPALIVAIMLLTGCARSGSEASSDTQWWNPLAKISWSSLSPLNWFGTSLAVSEQGVGDINGTTPMDKAAIDRGLNGDYTLRQGMRSNNGEVIAFWQALDDGKIKLVVLGKGTVNRIEVMDANIPDSDGTHVGDKFSRYYTRAFGHCQKAQGFDHQSIECKRSASSHLSYIYSGTWSGPESLLPPDDILTSWTISKIVWQR